MKKENYEQWKIIAWRFVRTAIAGGLSTALALQVVLQPDFSNIKVYVITFTSAFSAGFISSLALALRDYLSNGDKSDPIQKIPL